MTTGDDSTMVRELIDSMQRPETLCGVAVRLRQMAATKERECAVAVNDAKRNGEDVPPPMPWMRLAAEAQARHDMANHAEARAEELRKADAGRVRF